MIEIEIIGGPKDGELFALPDGSTHLTVARPIGPLDFTKAKRAASIETLSYDLPLCRDRRHKDRGPHVHWRER